MSSRSLYRWVSRGLAVHRVKVLAAALALVAALAWTVTARDSVVAACCAYCNCDQCPGPQGGGCYGTGSYYCIRGQSGPGQLLVCTHSDFGCPYWLNSGYC